jgi:hypothetical protein
LSDRTWGQWGNPISSTSLRAPGDCQLATVDSVKLVSRASFAVWDASSRVVGVLKEPARQRSQVDDGSTSSSSPNPSPVPVARGWTAPSNRSAPVVWGRQVTRNRTRGWGGLKRVEAGSSRAADRFPLSPHGRLFAVMIGWVPGSPSVAILGGQARATVRNSKCTK